MKSGSTKSETKVARLRCERGLTQAALAEKTGVNIRAIQRYESGERKIEGASLTVALRIADALGVHPLQFVVYGVPVNADFVGDFLDGLSALQEGFDPKAVIPG